MIPPRPRTLLLLAACLAPVLLAAGCDEAAYILTKTIGPFVPEEKHEAEFDLKDASVLVLVDVEDPTVASEFPRAETLLAKGITATLDEHEACGPVVPVRSVLAARRMEPEFAQWSVAQAGEYFNVDVVLHAQLFEFRVKDSPGSNVLRGYAEAAIRLVSPETGRQVWPVLEEARLVTAEALPEADVQEAARHEEELATGLGEKIARNFCTYKYSDLPLRPKVK
jgi:hypothetical protein